MSTALDTLNSKWDAASDRFNLLNDVAPGPEREINANIAAWQDYYWGESRSASGLLAWEQKYIRTIGLLDAAARRTTAAATVSQAAYFAKPKPAIRLPPLLVTAPLPRPPAPPDYIAPRPYQGYTSAPLPVAVPRRRIDMNLGTVDVSGWKSGPAAPVTIYGRDSGTGLGPWEPPLRKAQRRSKGLLALVGVVGAAIWAKREGVI